MSSAIVKDKNHPRPGLDGTDGNGLAKHPIVHIPEVQELNVDIALARGLGNAKFGIDGVSLDKLFPWLQVVRCGPGGFINILALPSAKNDCVVESRQNACKMLGGR